MKVKYIRLKTDSLTLIDAATRGESAESASRVYLRTPFELISNIFEFRLTLFEGYSYFDTARAFLSRQA